MKKRLILWILLLICTCANAEENVNVDLSPIYQFAEDYDAQQQVMEVYNASFKGEATVGKMMLDCLQDKLQAPLKELTGDFMEILPAILISTLINSMFSGDKGGSGGLRFLLRMGLLLSFTDIAIIAISSIETCVAAVKASTDKIAPILSTLLTLQRMEGSASLLSPVSILVGNITENLFLRYGLPLCRLTLCMAIAGNISAEIQLRRLVRLFMRLLQWGTGIVTTVFSAYLVLQGNINMNLDGIAIRAAKYAVDSAAPVIGSSISDVWENYLQGLTATKNAVGMSGIAALLFAVAKPIILCLGAMLGLNLIAALMDTFGESESAQAAEQISGVCQMALTICTASMTIGMILLGATTAMGKQMTV